MVNHEGLSIRRGFSVSPDPGYAANELYEKIAQPETSLALFFCGPGYDRPALARELNRHFKGVNLIGCTTAGEITPEGYMSETLTGVTIAGNGFNTAVSHLDNLKEFELAKAEELVKRLILDLQGQGVEPTGDNTFGLLLIDGLSMQEESVVSGLYHSLNDIPLLGGSAGDGVRFQRTDIFHDKDFYTDSAVFVMASTSYPFEVFKTEHFISSEEKMVVTGADWSRRIVTEINGYPAGREYARLVGLEVEELSPMIFATYPVVVKLGGEYYVRSIQKVNDDESLTFFCAIDEGLVLTVAKGVDMIQNLLGQFQEIEERMGVPQLVLGCDCILRNLELDQKGIKDEASAIFTRNNVVGFSTYGEQFNAMHMNQTFTAVAIGTGRQ